MAFRPTHLPCPDVSGFHVELFIVGIVALSLVPVVVEVARGRRESRPPLDHDTPTPTPEATS